MVLEKITIGSEVAKRATLTQFLDWLNVLWILKVEIDDKEVASEDR